MPGKIFINETADKQKVELTTEADGISGGYYDQAGVWNDFGGSADLLPKMTFKIKLTADSSEDAVGIYGFVILYNGILYGNNSPVPITVAKGEEAEITCYTWADYSGGDPVAVQGPELAFTGEVNVDSYTVSDLVNCSFQDDFGMFIVTDDSSTASATIEIKVSGG